MLLTALFLKGLELVLGAGIGALHAVLSLPCHVEKRKEGLGEAPFVVNGPGFDTFNAYQFPLADGHLLGIEPFRCGLRLPFGVQQVAKVLERFKALAGQDESAGAHAVPE